MKIAISVTDETLHEVDAAARCMGISRSEFFSRAAERWIDTLGRIPQEDDDLVWSDAATAAMIAEEPW